MESASPETTALPTPFALFHADPFGIRGVTGFARSSASGFNGLVGTVPEVRVKEPVEFNETLCALVENPPTSGKNKVAARTNECVLFTFITTFLSRFFVCLINMSEVYNRFHYLTRKLLIKLMENDFFIFS
jgi:hypothetical protein